MYHRVKIMLEFSDIIPIPALQILYKTNYYT